MGENVTKLRELIIHAFPGLASDVNFKITSPTTPIYNCIAWAYNYNDRWMWPNTDATSKLDGIYYWPNGIIKDCNVNNFIDAFKLKGYVLCDSNNFEQEYQKIALYVKKGTTECTHASRQLRNGFWTSKLGNGNDIQHGDPYTIEGKCYGEVYCIMKRKFN